MAKKQQSNYLASCQKLGITPKEAPQAGATDRDIYDYHMHVLGTCVGAENAIEQPDGTFKEWKAPKDGKTVTYQPWFIKSGSGWAYYYYDSWFLNSVAGPRREYSSYELMMEGVEEFDQYYQAVYSN